MTTNQIIVEPELILNPETQLVTVDDPSLSSVTLGKRAVKLIPTIDQIP